MLKSDQETVFRELHTCIHTPSHTQLPGQTVAPRAYSTAAITWLYNKKLCFKVQCILYMYIAVYI